MKLSAEQFAELAASFPGYETGQAKEERRRSARMDLRSNVNIRMLEEGVLLRPVTIAVNNFSPRGLGLLLHEPLDSGTQLVANLPRKSGGSLLFLCTVMHSRLLSEGLYQMGVEFTCVLPQPQPGAEPQNLADELQRIRRSVLD